MKPDIDLDLESLCQSCIQIAEQAGEKILEIYCGDFEIESKTDNTPLTSADMAAHYHIVDALTVLTPDLPVLSEEAADIPFSIRKTWQTYWLVDPLDGTREFIKGNGEFSVNIALIHRHRSILGVINAPVHRQTYFAYHGNGAYKKSADSAAVKIACRKAEPDHLIVAGSRSHRSDRLKQFLAKLNNPQVISMGSSLKSCLVAEGLADIYPRLGLTSEWDTAAAHCIVDEAGGQITKTDNQALLYNTKESLLNPDFFVTGQSDLDWQDYL
ncbi:MAG: 3'(2'),5'-bisphosphate nucleotidase CysQ [Gammaproteobacteria bacterium]|nr:3'(2'),5'-bisphosphate nucleotidase CysQ [Gammaproteobacteria bacterium]